MKKKNPTSRSFDCVAFKRRAQARIYQDIKGMTPEEEIAYFEKRAEKGKLGAWWSRVKAQGPHRATRR